MFASSSIFNSNKQDRSGASAKNFGRRLLLFFAPYILFSAVAGTIAAGSGEFLPVTIVAWLQTFREPFLFLPKLSDHTYKLKLEAVRRLKPEILALGASRGNQWRRAMFSPATFYNAANAIYANVDYGRMLDDLGDYAPRVLIVPIDFYTFSDDWDAVFRKTPKDDLNYFDPPELIAILKKSLGEFSRDPMSFVPFQREPVYRMPALGLGAVQFGDGIRIDGSFQYGHVMSGGHLETLEGAMRRLASGIHPLPFGDHLDPGPRRDFEDFTKLALAKGIAVVGVTLPFDPTLAAALDTSSRHGIWNEFNAPETADWMRRQGVLYFNFMRLDSFGGKPDEFIDPFHPSEPAYIRMLLAMLQDVRFRALFPRMEEASLRQRLSRSTRLEAYGNDF